MRPIVLAHGYFGFASIGPLQYFSGVQQDLESRFQAENLRIITPSVPPLDSIADRAASLKAQIENALLPAERARPKPVHVIAHSMGGLDSRYMISAKGLNAPSLVASLTTISTPHLGTALADFALGRADLSISKLTSVLAQLGHGIFQKMWQVLLHLGQNPSLHLPSLSSVGGLSPFSLLQILEGSRAFLRQLFPLADTGLQELTTHFIQSEFNARHSDLQGVPCLRYAGISRPADNLSAGFYLPYLVLLALEGESDGVVSLASAHWGGDAEDIPADHLQEVGLAQTLQDWLNARLPVSLPALPASYPHLELYREITAKLVAIDRQLGD